MIMKMNLRLFVCISIFLLIALRAGPLQAQYKVPPEPNPRPTLRLEEIRAQSTAKNFEAVGQVLLTWPGAGSQIALAGDIAYVALMPPAIGTDIIDVSDPSSPKLVGHINPPGAPNVHSHKVRVCGDTLVTNAERNRFVQPSEWKGGLAIWDISDKIHPKFVKFVDVPGQGVHRIFYDCLTERVYMNATDDGYLDSIEWVLDLKDPAQPVLLSKLWYPGQKNGEPRDWIPGDWGDPRPKKRVAPHNVMPYGNRLYAAWWDAGLTIWDITDIAKPKLLGSRGTKPPDQGAMHSSYLIRGYPLVATNDEWIRCPQGYVRMWDVRDETSPMQISTFQLPIDKKCPEPVTGVQTAHTIAEPPVLDWQDWPLNLLFVAWTGQGLRVVDIADPYLPVEAGYFVPPSWPGSTDMSGKPGSYASDVTIDWKKRLVFLTDRVDHGGGGLYILKWTGGEGKPITFVGQ
jgi:hypothetical protein